MCGWGSVRFGVNTPEYSSIIVNFFLNLSVKEKCAAIIFLIDTSQGPSLSSSRCSAGGNRQSPHSSPHKSADGESVKKEGGREERYGAGGGASDIQQCESLWTEAKIKLHWKSQQAVLCNFSTFLHEFAYIYSVCEREIGKFVCVCILCMFTWASFTVIWPLSRLPWKPVVTFHTRSPGRTRCTKLAGKYPTLSLLFPW